MITARVPDNEIERLSELNSYNILDSLPERDFDHITKLASQICNTPISLISIIDSNRQWFKSKQGLEVQETPRDVAFCAHAILQPDEMFEVPNSFKDDRFHDNPLVTGEPRVVFYAGIPLVTEGGYPLGTLCVLDNKPKELTLEQKESMKALAQQVVCLLELRKRNIQLDESKAALGEVNKELERFAYVVAHDLKSPCNNLIMLSDFLAENYAGKIDAEGQQMLGFLKDVSSSLSSLIDGILRHSLNTEIGVEKELFGFQSLMGELHGMLHLPANFKFTYTQDGSMIFARKTALMQILLNLCTNAIKYNDKENGWVDVSFMQDKDFYRFTVEDNGRGIPADSHKAIFDLFHTLGSTDRFEQKGQGIGLSTVKKLVEKMGGSISVSSEPGSGSVFSFFIRK